MDDLEKKIMEREQAGENIVRYLEFSLGTEHFAIPLPVVNEVIAMPAITPVPMTPSHFLGVINLRGQVLSIIDLRRKLNITKRQDSSEEAIIIGNVGFTNLGMTVDSINKVLPINEKLVNGTPNIESKIRKDYITGIYNIENSLVFLLDLKKILTPEDLKKSG